MNPIDAALAYAERGYPVLPIESVFEGHCTCAGKCSHPGKHPISRLVPNGFYGASTDAATIRRWWTTRPDANVAIRTGPLPDGRILLAIDLDPRSYPAGINSWDQLRDDYEGAVPGDTPFHQTGSGGEHYFFTVQSAEPWGNGGKLFRDGRYEGIEFKCGGYVVAPPSRHVSGKQYVLGTPNLIDDPPVPCPTWLLRARADGEIRESAKPKAAPANSRLLARARGYLRGMGPAVEGKHGDDLTYKAACSVVRGFNLGEDDAFAVLSEWNETCTPPWPEADIRAKIEHAKKYGTEPFGHLLGREEIAIPGPHQTLKGGKPHSFEIREDDFVDKVLRSVPAGTFYRRAEVVGLINDGRFSPIESDDAIPLIAKHTDFRRYTVAGKSVKAVTEPDGSIRAPKPGEEGEEIAKPEEVSRWQAVSSSYSRIIIAAAKRHPAVRDLRRIVSYPVYDSAWNVCAHGWNDSGTYYTGQPVNPDPRPSVDAIREVVGDFPWKSEADFQNWLLGLLAPIIRPAIEGNVPWFFVEAPLERTGKTMLTGTIVGKILTGEPMAVCNLPPKDEELEKQITAFIMEGTTLILFDNVGHFVRSPCLAKLLTARTYAGRILGASKTVRLPNETVLYGTGNNLHSTGEVAKRIVPIILQPDTPRPDLRSGFRHENLPAYVSLVRPRILSMLVGMVEAWKRAGRPASRKRLGGFEEFLAAAGGILDVAGLTEYLNNRDEWLGAADDESDEFERFIAAWGAIRHPGKPRTAGEILREVDADSMPECVRVLPTEVGRSSALAQKVLKRILNRPFTKFTVRKVTSGNNAAYFLREQAPDTLQTGESGEMGESTYPAWGTSGG